MTTPAPPVTLTPQQFGKTGAAAKPGATYAKYLSFVKARRGGTLTGSSAPPPDPYSGIISSLPQPETSGQMQTEAQGEISPIVAAIVAAISKQTKGATNAISGYSNDAAAKLAAINYGAPYTQGEGAQAATDATLASAESGQGLSDANSLQQRLAVINDPSVAAAAANVQGNGTANGNAALSQGSASLSNLIANAAAAKDYGNKQPGIQRAQGLQDIAGVQQTGEANIASGTTAAEQQLPSILSSLRSENDNRSTAIAGAKENQLARQDALAAGGQKESDIHSAAILKAQTVNANNQVKLTIAGENNATRVQVAAESRAAAAARASVSAAAKRNKPPPASTLKYWATTADNLYNGVAPKTHYVAQHTDPKTGKIVPGGFVAVPGTGSSAVHWNVAIKELMARGASRDKAIELLDAQGWQPGQGGRPLTPQQKAAQRSEQQGFQSAFPNPLQPGG